MCQKCDWYNFFFEKKSQFLALSLEPFTRSTLGGIGLLLIYQVAAYDLKNKTVHTGE